MIDLHSTTDAQEWASQWCLTAIELVAEGKDLIDQGWMLGWFANAIEAGRTAGQAWSLERSAELSDAQEQEAALLDEIANLRNLLARVEPTAGVGP